MTASLIPDDGLRKQLHTIVTRNGKSGRIPELLDDELDKLMALIQSREQAIRQEAEREGRKDELNLFKQYDASSTYLIAGDDLRQYIDGRIKELSAPTNSRKEE